jgi:hypothetical protein
MSEIGFNPEEDIITIDGTSHPILFGEADKPNAEYSILPYKFTDETGEQADGCVFEIAPHGSTTVMRVVNEHVRIQEIAVSGSGWFMGMNPEGEIIAQEVGENVDENPIVDQTKGWVGVWIAGENGMKVLDVTTPPFSPSMEVAVKREDAQMPQDFWKEYDARKPSAAK